MPLVGSLIPVSVRYKAYLSEKLKVYELLI